MDLRTLDRIVAELLAGVAAAHILLPLQYHTILDLAEFQVFWRVVFQNVDHCFSLEFVSPGEPLAFAKGREVLISHKVNVARVSSFRKVFGNYLLLVVVLVVVDLLNRPFLDDPEPGFRLSLVEYVLVGGVDYPGQPQR